MILCEKCTNNPSKKNAFMLPLCRVSKVITKVLEISCVFPSLAPKKKAVDDLLKPLRTHSSRQGKVVFVKDACSLGGACIATFRWIHGTLPDTY